jgi:DNA-binding XRE family transcriptional regulator
MKPTSDPRAAAEYRGRPQLPRGRPRVFAEWQALRRWGKLPVWERQVAGYLLRDARVSARPKQRELAAHLGVTQQAIAQAERWVANPTVDFMRRWAEACGATLEILMRSSASGAAPREPAPSRHR